MTLIVCTDNAYGISFNDRPVSRDSGVIRDILNNLGRTRLYIDEKDRKMFLDYLDPSKPEYIPQIKVVNDVHEYLRKHPKSRGYFFLSRNCSDQEVQNAYHIIMYGWNREYPADERFPAFMLTDFIEIGTVDMPGYSHEKITRHIYRRKRSLRNLVGEI